MVTSDTTKTNGKELSSFLRRRES